MERARVGRGTALGGSDITDSGINKGWMWLFWLLLVLGVVLLVMVLVRAGRRRRRRPPEGRQGAGPQPGRSRARELLDERYARGEISSEEYHERRSALGEDT